MSCRLERRFCYGYVVFATIGKGKFLGELFSHEDSCVSFRFMQKKI